MELNDKIKFKIICGFDDLLEISVSKYNQVYETNFLIEEYIEDEVNIAIISATKYTISDVFGLGYCYGCFLKSKRNTGEVDY
jgi:hypothetical protein